MLTERATVASTRMNQFRAIVLEKVPVLADYPKLCIYTTGSFGRKEPGQHSDLDLFFVYDGNKDDVGRLDKTLIDADLIRLCHELGYPKFSNDGEYLKIHSVDDLAKKIGNQQEDAENIFTARMLLCLESASLFNDGIYKETIRRCVKEYCRDYEDHQGNFRPTFLTNDIVRFWKTLCLNYESARTGATPATKPKHQLKNFKLKFSRLLTCFSMLACLCDPAEAAGPEKVTHLVELTPRERLAHITAKHGLTELHGQLLAEYEWFLRETDKDKESGLAWIAENKADVFRRASTFGNLIFDLLKNVAEKTHTDLRYLVV